MISIIGVGVLAALVLMYLTIIAYVIVRYRIIQKLINIAKLIQKTKTALFIANLACGVGSNLLAAGLIGYLFIPPDSSLLTLDPNLTIKMMVYGIIAARIGFFIKRNH